MEMSKEDYLKKALLDTQERVRDYTAYADHLEDENLKQLFGNFAVTEGEHARELQSYLSEK